MRKSSRYRSAGFRSWITIDVNPVAAGIVEVPESSPHTSITARVEHVKEQCRIPDLTTAFTRTAYFHGERTLLNSNGTSVARR